MTDTNERFDAAGLRLADFRPRAMLRRERTIPPRAAVPAIDVHNHLGQAHLDWDRVSAADIVAVLDACGISGIVNLDGNWGEELQRNLRRYDEAYPGRFATFCRVDWSQCATPGWPARVAHGVRDAVRRGAAGLKIAKDLGLEVRDEHGDHLLCDDDRLTPLWDVLAEAGLPVLIHVADPLAFFEPLDASNERVEELAAHPDWHFHGRDVPSLPRLLDGLERLVSTRSDVTFIGAHVACLAEDLDWVRRMLGSYPNLYVDMAARLSELGRQPYRSRQLMLDFPDRVLFGTDTYPPDVDTYRCYFEFLQTRDECFPYSPNMPPWQGRWDIYGVGLPAEVLSAVLRDNASRLVPRLDRG